MTCLECGGGMNKEDLIFEKKTSYDRVTRNLCQLYRKLKISEPDCEQDMEEFEYQMYPCGTMFAYWFEDLMGIVGWRNLNYETQEISRRYWDHYHYS